MKFLFGMIVGLVVGWSAPSHAQTAEEIVQKQLGQLMIANANCSVQTMTASSELQKVKAELAEPKAKLPAPVPADMVAPGKDNPPATGPFPPK